MPVKMYHQSTSQFLKLALGLHKTSGDVALAAERLNISTDDLIRLYNGQQTIDVDQLTAWNETLFQYYREGWEQYGEQLIKNIQTTDREKVKAFLQTYLALRQPKLVTNGHSERFAKPSASKNRLQALDVIDAEDELAFLRENVAARVAWRQAVGQFARKIIEENIGKNSPDFNDEVRIVNGLFKYPPLHDEVITQSQFLRYDIEKNENGDRIKKLNILKSIIAVADADAGPSIRRKPDVKNVEHEFGSEIPDRFYLAVAKSICTAYMLSHKDPRNVVVMKLVKTGMNLEY